MVNATTIDLLTLEELIVRLDDLDRQGAIGVVERAVSAGATLDRVVSGLLAPAQLDAGRRWAAGELGAVEAQAATGIVRAALARATPTAIVTDKPLVAVACPEGEHHELAAEMVTELLRASGWPATSIGVPASGLREYLERRRPAALLLSCTTACGLAGAARAIDVAHNCGIGVIVGGAAFGRDGLRALRLGADAWAPTVKAAAETLDRWQAKPLDVPVGRSLSSDYLALAAVIPQIRATVGDVLRRSGLRRAEDAAELAGLRDRLDLVLAYLGAAVLVDEGQLFADFVSWQLNFFRARDLAGERLGQTLAALAHALPEDQLRARLFVEEGARPVRPDAKSLEARPSPVDGPAAALGGASAVGTAPGSPSARAAPPAQPASLFSVSSVAGSDVTQGQVFADLLFLAAMSCHAPMALIAVAQAEGQWSTLSYGVDRREVLSDPDLFAAVAAGTEPLEIQALGSHARLGTSPLATGPLAVRFVYGVPLRTRDVTVGVFCVLDRRTREMTGRQQQAMNAIARQVSGQLALWRRSGGGVASPVAHPVNRRRDPNRKGPDAALADLVGLRRAGFGVDQHLLRSHEVAVLFDVTERTVINWAASGKLASLRTAGGHLRFRSDDVLALLDKRAGTATV
jgi:MerR family transcriptional regulator, light-induced transcriptional regulator